MSAKTVNLPWTTVITDSTSEEFIPATGWMSTNGVRQIRCAWELQAPGGSVTVRPGFQFANTYDDPQSFDSFNDETATSTTGYHFPDAYEDPTKTTPDHTGNMQIMRYGWLVKVTDGTGFARVGGTVQIVSE